MSREKGSSMKWVLALGLVLIALGIYFFFRTVFLLEEGYIISSLLTTLIGGIIFLSGISLVRVYIAREFF
ncbi:MAG: hypothetical protein DRO00_03145 [Thermoproteota archaeon]|nr:MAG: hypothetical protein DRO00_03145 [Candidatus Korarchaeota archaeon]